MDCSGIYLGGKVVLTAAHSAAHVGVTKVSFPVDSLDDTNNTNTYNVTSVYNRADVPGGGGTNDLAVLILSGNPSGPPVSLASPNIFDAAKADGDPLIACGFGESQVYPKGTKRANNPGGRIWKDAETSALPLAQLLQLRNFDSNYELVAFGNQNSTSPWIVPCDGDSGGPVYVNDYDNRVVIGIDSRRVLQSAFSCGSDQWGSIYTRVDAHLGWIRQKALLGGLAIP